MATWASNWWCFFTICWSRLHVAGCEECKDIFCKVARNVRLKQDVLSQDIRREGLLKSSRMYYLKLCIVTNSRSFKISRVAVIAYMETSFKRINVQNWTVPFNSNFNVCNALSRSRGVRSTGLKMALKRCWLEKTLQRKASVYWYSRFWEGPWTRQSRCPTGRNVHCASAKLDMQVSYYACSDTQWQGDRWLPFFSL